MAIYFWLCQDYVKVHNPYFNNIEGLLKVSEQVNILEPVQISIHTLNIIRLLK